MSKRVTPDAADDQRLGTALAALNVTSKRRGRKPEWGPFDLMIVWIFVEAKKRAFDLNDSEACNSLVRECRKWPAGRQISIGRLKAYYIAAKKRFKTGDLASDLEQADRDADAMAREFRSKRGWIAAAKRISETKRNF